MISPAQHRQPIHEARQHRCDAAPQARESCMPDTPIVIVEHARRRTAQVRAGDVPAALQDGPKWVCRIVPDHAQRSCEGHRSAASAAGMLGRLKPANVVLTDPVASAGGWLARSSTDGAGRCRAYAHLGADRILEMVGMPGVGPWLDEHDTWWPGAYELPLLEQLSANASPLRDLLCDCTRSSADEPDRSRRHCTRDRIGRWHRATVPYSRRCGYDPFRTRMHPRASGAVARNARHRVRPRPASGRAQIGPTFLSLTQAPVLRQATP